MRRVVFIAAIFCISGSVFFSCKTIQPAKPTESYTLQKVEPQASVINLYANLEVAKLQALINDQTDSLLYSDTSFEDNNNDNLKMTIWKNGIIELFFINDELLWNLPLRVIMRKGATVFNMNVPFLKDWEYNGEIVLRFKTKLSIKSDWSIATSTKTDGYDWIKKPTVRIGTTNIPITLFADLVLSIGSDELSKMIDSSISENFDFRKLAQSGWHTIQQPMKIPGDYNAWLAINPKSISIMPVKGSNGKIQFGVAVSSQVECLVDSVPVLTKKAELPNLQTLKQVADSFQVNLLTNIPYTTISRMTMEEIGDSTFTFGSKRIRFETFSVYGSNGKMIIETKVRGSVKGVLYLSGIPVFNSVDTTLRIKDLKFDIKTRNIMTKSANWLFGGKIEKAITEAFVIPFNTNVAEVEKEISSFITHYPLGYGLELNGKLGRLSVSELILSPDAVKANVLFSGNLGIGVVGSITENKK